MTPLLFLAATLYVDGYSQQELADLAAWASTHKDDVLTIEDYITPDEQ